MAEIIKVKSHTDRYGIKSLEYKKGRKVLARLVYPFYKGGYILVTKPGATFGFTYKPEDEDKAKFYAEQIVRDGFDLACCICGEPVEDPVFQY